MSDISEQLSLRRLRTVIDLVLRGVIERKIDDSSYQHIANVLQSELDCDSICVFFYNHRLRKIENAGASGFDEEFSNDLDKRKGAVRNDYIGRRIVSTKSPLVLHDFGDIETSSQPPEKSGVSTMMLIPVRLDIDVIMGLAICTYDYREWSDDELDWYDLLAQYCGVIMRLIQKSQRAEILRADVEREIYKTVRDQLLSMAESFNSKCEHEEENLEDTHVEEILTPREKDVLFLLSTGSSNEEIAETLCISMSTVKKHVNAVFKKMNLKNRTQAAVVWKNR